MTSTISLPRSTSDTARGLTRWVPRLVLVAAAMHLMVALTNDGLRQLVSDGMWNTVTLDSTDGPPGAALWYLVAGIGFFGVGLLARRAATDTGKLPVELGWTLLAMGGATAAFMPMSGGWIVLLCGALAFVARSNRK